MQIFREKLKKKIHCHQSNCCLIPEKKNPLKNPTTILKFNYILNKQILRTGKCYLETSSNISDIKPNPKRMRLDNFQNQFAFISQSGR